MSTHVIPFEGSSLPAHIAEAFKSEGNEFGFSGGGGFPSLSIKGKVFTINRDGTKTLLNTPGTDDEPARFIEVVILDSAPKGGNFSKTFYEHGYVEGSTEKPTCFSNDGVAPSKDAADPQSTKCAMCQHNAKGSGATQQNPNAKACRSSKLLAVAPAGQIDDPLLLKVPGASCKALGEYGEFLAKRGAKAAAVVTKIGFDYSVAHPALTFKAVGWVPPEVAKQVLEVKNSDKVKWIIGEKSMPKSDLDDEIPPAPTLEKPAPTPPPAPAATAKPAKPAAKPAPPKAPVAEDDDLPAAPKAKVKVEGDEETPAPKKVAASKGVTVADDDIDSALDSVDFDD